MVHARGDNVVRINYLGDWGEQFSKLIVGYEEFRHEYNDIWDNESIAKLVSIYVRISELEREPQFIRKINNAAERLNSNDPAALQFHHNCVVASEKEYRKQYQLFNVSFDQWERESTQRFNFKIK